MIRYRLDPSTTSIVGVCHEPGCPYRVITSTRDAARRARDAHEEAVHMTRGRHTTRRRTQPMRTV